VLRTLTLGVALLGDLPLAITSIAWILASRASDTLRLTAYVWLPLLSFVLCMWHLCSALVAVVESAAHGPGQSAAAKLFGDVALLQSPPRSADEPAMRVDRAPQHLGHLDAAAPSNGSFPSAPLPDGRQRPAPSGRIAGDALDASHGLLEAASALASSPSRFGVAPAAVVVGNPLQQPPPPHSAGRVQQRGDAVAPNVAVARVTASSSSGVACLTIHAAVEALSRELGVSPPSLSGPIGVENLQRIGELWARAATDEARRLAHMSTFWSRHLFLLPAALDGVLQSPLPPAWLRLLRALEGAERDRDRVYGVDSDTASCRDEVAASCSE